MAGIPAKESLDIGQDRQTGAYIRDFSVCPLSKQNIILFLTRVLPQKPNMLHFRGVKIGLCRLNLRHLLFCFLSAFVWTDRQKPYIDILVCLSMYICSYMYLSVTRKNTKNYFAVCGVVFEKLYLSKMNFTQNQKSMKTIFLTVIFTIVVYISHCQSLKDVEGDYVVSERNLVKQGEILRYPFNGRSITYSIKLGENNTASVTQTIFVRGKRDFQQVFKITLLEKIDRVEWSEIWESGELQASGYIVGNQFVATMKERLTNYVVSKDIAIK